MGVLLMIIKGFRNRKLKLLFPVLGVVVGVMSVVVISSVGAIGKELVGREVKGLGLGGLMISASLPEKALTEDELEYLRASQAVSSATAVIYNASTIENRNGERPCVLWGVDDSTSQIMSLELVYGREISQGDIYCEENVCLVDASYAKENYGRENIVGKKINVALLNGYEEFTVVGIVDSDSSLVKSFVSDYVPCFVYIPYTLMKTATGDTFFSNIAVNISEDLTVQQAETAIMAGLNELSSSNDAYKIENMLTYSETIEKILSIITFVLSGIAGISLLVSGISIMTVMMFSVSERTREIGIKKAIGAGFFDIMFEFLSQGAAISLIGAVIGALLGIAATFVGCSIFSVTAVFDSKMILICMAAAVVFGIVFSIYPAQRAARLDPAEALRRN
ncbi:MAG: ABC transporter permease [Oscillospiraceae bacterium]|nr:ABC transporter permease [Oscillospiraceae bacterium]